MTMQPNPHPRCINCPYSVNRDAGQPMKYEAILPGDRVIGFFTTHVARIERDGVDVILYFADGQSYTGVEGFSTRVIREAQA